MRQQQQRVAYIFQIGHAFLCPWWHLRQNKTSHIVYLTLMRTCLADAEYNLDGYSKAQGIFGVFNALGTVAFAYGGHNVILEIQVQ